ncbi:MAG: hypothetical protein GX591_04910 [Planctomycetes bacterium]|nr:hypothetical protein [Planctomycetota bacterium]
MERLRCDHRRVVEQLGRQSARPRRWAPLHPSFVCVLLHRISRWLFGRRRYYLARAVWHLNLLLTGADISENSDLGGGLLVVQPAGLAIMARAGRNLTVMPNAGLGGELGRDDDVGAGPGLPVVGDDVVLGAHAGILGPVRVGSRVLIRPGCAVLSDVPDDTLVEVPAPRRFPRKDTP